MSTQLKKDFEEDKQAAVARAMTNVTREIEKARKATEEKCKEQYMEEMKKLATKHKEAISMTKKKQWVCTVGIMFLYSLSSSSSHCLQSHHCLPPSPLLPLVPHTLSLIHI